MSAQASSQEILSLQEQEKELEAQYYYTYAQATVETQMGELFMQLVQLRRQMAQALGYESYTRVADLEMLRIGYTREEIRSFREQLKQTLAPEYGLVLSSPYVDANTFAKSWFTTNQYFDTPFMQSTTPCPAVLPCSFCS